MELREMIEAGVAKAGGNVAELARAIGSSRETVSRTKSHKQPLTLEACARLAQYIEIQAIEVIAANRRATATKEEDREFWKIFGKAASICALSLVTFFVTPSPAEAAPVQEGPILRFVLCKIRKQGSMSKKRHLSRSIAEIIKRIQKALLPLLAIKPTQMQPV